MAAQDSFDGGRTGMSLMHRVFQINLVLVILICLPALVGFAMLYSAAGGNMEPWAAPQIIRFGVGLVIMFTVALVDIRFWIKSAYFIYAAAFVLLFGVELFGDSAMGAQRWVDIGPLQLQPSEIMKVVAVLYAADYTVRKQEYMHKLTKGFLPMAGAIGLVGLLLLLEPDLGAFGVIVCIAMGILFLGGINAIWFGGIGALLVVIFSTIIALSPFRRARMFAYLDPWQEDNALNKAYQLTHSLIAFGRGEIFGVGLGGSVEKLHYLPEAHTDFLLAVIGEELGLAGVLVTIALFYWLVKRAFDIGRQAIAIDQTFAGLAAKGIGIWIGVQCFINMGVNLGLLPTKGLTLPLMSYGGTGVFINCIGLAILLRIDYENRVLMRGGRP